MNTLEPVVAQENSWTTFYYRHAVLDASFIKIWCHLSVTRIMGVVVSGLIATAKSAAMVPEA